MIPNDYDSPCRYPEVIPEVKDASFIESVIMFPGNYIIPDSFENWFTWVLIISTLISVACGVLVSLNRMDKWEVFESDDECPPPAFFFGLATLLYPFVLSIAYYVGIVIGIPTAFYLLATKIKWKKNDD